LDTAHTSVSTFVEAIKAINTETAMGDTNWINGARIMRDGFNQWMNGPRPTAEQLSTLHSRLDYARHTIAAAEFVSRFTHHPGALRRLQQARHAIGVIANGLGHLETANDIADVLAAIGDLQRIGPVGRNPNGAARAFGQLFSALGRLSSHLPPPLNSYSDFLAGSSEFFTNMLGALDPAQRYAGRADGEGGAVDTSRPYRP
jgi:hypothetical protein